jgi:hypothetical protein
MDAAMDITCWRPTAEWIAASPRALVTPTKMQTISRAKRLDGNAM